MNTTTNSPIKKRPVDFLRDVYNSRKERNPAYSISAFARDLGISVSLLSRVFSGARPLSLKLAVQISSALDLNDGDSQVLLLSVIQNSSKTAKISKKIRIKLEQQESTNKQINSSSFFTTVEIEQFKALSSWYHLAILNLTSIDGFKSDVGWVAKTLGISTGEARAAIERLISIGLLNEEGDQLKRTQKNFYFKTHKSEFAIRKFHEQMIAKATEELKKTSNYDFQNRLINGITFACGAEQIEIIKDKINRLEDEILELTSHGERKSVYQMNIQFFPLSKREEQEQ